MWDGSSMCVQMCDYYFSQQDEFLKSSFSTCPLLNYVFCLGNHSGGQYKEIVPCIPIILTDQWYTHPFPL